MKATIARLGIASALAAAASALALTPAHATLINYSVSFSVPHIAPVDNLDPFFPANGPVQNLTGTLTLQFDDAANAFGLLQTAVLSADGGIDASDFGPMGFRYTKASDLLSLGACDDSGCDAVPGTDNIVITVLSATGAGRRVDHVAYSFVGEGNEYNAFDDPAPPFGTNNFITETITFAPVPTRTDVPEPASLSLLALALGAIGVTRRRRAA